jgi:hypothetical protein
MDGRLALPLESILTTMSWAEASDELRRRYFIALWGQCRGNVSAIARRAKVDRQRARDSLRALGLNGDGEGDGIEAGGGERS